MREGLGNKIFDLGHNNVNPAFFQVRFLSDLVICLVFVAASFVAMFDNFVEVTLEDNIPQVGSHGSQHCASLKLLFPPLTLNPEQTISRT